MRVTDGEFENYSTQLSMGNYEQMENKRITWPSSSLSLPLQHKLSVLYNCALCSRVEYLPPSAI